MTKTKANQNKIRILVVFQKIFRPKIKMSQQPQRHLIRIIIQNFINSLKPRQIKGNFMGEDYFGNKYYEIPANPSIGKRKSSRWFEPKDKDAFDQEITAEWEAWLRGRRNDPPTPEELVRNLQLMELKKKNAAELELKYASSHKDTKNVPKEEKGYGSFPKYDEYEVVPGKDPKNQL